MRARVGVTPLWPPAVVVLPAAPHPRGPPRAAQPVLAAPVLLQPGGELGPGRPQPPHLTPRPLGRLEPRGRAVRVLAPLPLPGEGHRVLPYTRADGSRVAEAVRGVVRRFLHFAVASTPRGAGGNSSKFSTCPAKCQRRRQRRRRRRQHHVHQRVDCEKVMMTVPRKSTKRDSKRETLRTPARLLAGTIGAV